MKKILVTSVLITVLLSVVFFWVQRPGGEQYIMVRTDDGYEPQNLTIKVGDTVVFKNESSEYHWPASDLHPTHGAYPAFDPRTPIAPGEEWSFRFTQAGAWSYHDHLRANLTGVIIAE